MRKPFPHATEVLKVVEPFNIGGRMCYLYYSPKNSRIIGRVITGDTKLLYSLYWEDEQMPIQKNMNASEVFTVISHLLGEVYEKSIEGKEFSS